MTGVAKGTVIKLLRDMGLVAGLRRAQAAPIRAQAGPTPLR